MSDEHLDTLITLLRRVVERLPERIEPKWSRMEVVAPVLVSLGLGVGGWVSADAIAGAQQAFEAVREKERKEQEAENARQTGERDSRDREDRLQREQAEQLFHEGQLFATLTEAILSPDPARACIAVNTIPIVLPQRGPQLLEAVATASGGKVRCVKHGEAAPAQTLQQRSDDVLRSRQDELVQLLFANTPEESRRGLALLRSGWTSNSAAVAAVLKRSADADGFALVNALGFLVVCSSDVLSANEADVRRVLDVARKRVGYEDFERKLIERVSQRLRQP